MHPGAPRPPLGTRRLRATPLARRIALEQQIDLASITGSGPHGRIGAADVRIHQAASAVPAPFASTTLVHHPSSSLGVPGSAGVPPASGLSGQDGRAAEPQLPANFRQAVLVAEQPAYLAPAPGATSTIGVALRELPATIPVATTTIEVELDAAIALLGRLGEAYRLRRLPLSLTTLVCAASAEVLPQHPTLNGAWGGDVAILRRRLHLAVAAPAAHGLEWRLVHDAGDLTLRGMARALAAPAAPVSEATFAIVSLAPGQGRYTAVPPLPDTAATLSLGAPESRVVVGATGMQMLPLAWLTLSYDARLIDHAQATTFLLDLRIWLAESMRHHG